MSDYSGYSYEDSGKKKKRGVSPFVIGGTIAALLLIGGGVAAVLVFLGEGEMEGNNTRSEVGDPNVLDFGLFMLSDLLLVILYSQTVNTF